jgi:hypothetical protein
MWFNLVDSSYPVAAARGGLMLFMQYHHSTGDNVNNEQKRPNIKPGGFPATADHV